MTDQADMEARANWHYIDMFRTLKGCRTNIERAKAASLYVAQAEAATKTARARELGIMDRVLTDAENAIYDAGMATAYARAAEVCDEHGPLHCEVRIAIEALGEAKG